MRQQSHTRAVKEAHDLFKPIAKKPPTDYEQAQQTFHANRERLKAERLAREAERRGKPDRAS
ncbi:hypothetical protein SE91_07485 [Bradyrhizobium sp. DOA1]|nr:hypothetical protein [Bradyrhizobium sp. DOA1]KYG98374.1 hypothetical protein SE91_07485 [Bradyrhizobium sp. DOA1]